MQHDCAGGCGGNELFALMISRCRNCSISSFLAAALCLQSHTHRVIYTYVLSAQKPKLDTREHIVTKKREHDGWVQECGSCCLWRSNNVLRVQKGCEFWWLLCQRFLPISSASQQGSVVLRWHGALRRNSFFNFITKTSQHTITLLLLDKRQSLLNRNALPGLRRQFPSQMGVVL